MFLFSKYTELFHKGAYVFLEKKKEMFCGCKRGNCICKKNYQGYNIHIEHEESIIHYKKYRSITTQTIATGFSDDAKDRLNQLSLIWANNNFRLAVVKDIKSYLK
jgi:hypothetical protein